MIIRENPQGTPDWLADRCGIPTASEFDNLISPTFEIRKGEMPKSYLAQKVAEMWSGKVENDFGGSFDMEQGNILEEEARPFAELTLGCDIRKVGLCVTDNGRIGASPDGLIGDDGGLELKAPKAKTHVGYLLKGELPACYALQVHGCMFVTGRKWWKFMSYRRGFPPLLLHIDRDESIQEKIAAALGAFLKDMDLAMQKLKNL